MNHACAFYLSIEGSISVAKALDYVGLCIGHLQVMRLMFRYPRCLCGHFPFGCVHGVIHCSSVHMLSACGVSPGVGRLSFSHFDKIAVGGSAVTHVALPILALHLYHLYLVMHCLATTRCVIVCLCKCHIYRCPLV